MTVKELIARLQEFPEDMELISSIPDGYNEKLYLLQEYCPQEYTVREDDDLAFMSDQIYPILGKKYCYI